MTVDRVELSSKDSGDKICDCSLSAAGLTDKEYRFRLLDGHHDQAVYAHETFAPEDRVEGFFGDR